MPCLKGQLVLNSRQLQTFGNACPMFSRENCPVFQEKPEIQIFFLYVHEFEYVHIKSSSFKKQLRRPMQCIYELAKTQIFQSVVKTMVVVVMNLLADVNEKRASKPGSILGWDHQQAQRNDQIGWGESYQLQPYESTYCFYHSKVVTYRQLIWDNLIKD